MYRDIKQFRNLQFPLYAINSDNWDKVDGLVFIDGIIVDDLNRSGHSIGIRRLQTGRDKDSLYRLKQPLFYLDEVLASRKRHFISSCGKPFTYVKTGFQHIKYHRIKRFEMRDTFTFVWVDGITIPFEIPRPPVNMEYISWARILYYGKLPWLVYDFQVYEGRTQRIKV